MAAEIRGTLRFRVRSAVIRNYDKEITEMFHDLLFVSIEYEEQADGEMTNGIYHCMEGVFYHGHTEGISWETLNDPLYTTYMLNWEVPKVLNFKQLDFVRNGAFVADVWRELDIIRLARVSRITRIPNGEQSGKAVLTRGKNLGLTGTLAAYTIRDAAVKWSPIRIYSYFRAQLNPTITFP